MRPIHEIIDCIMQSCVDWWKWKNILPPSSGQRRKKRAVTLL
jgi:hypothetical protein